MTSLDIYFAFTFTIAILGGFAFFISGMYFDTENVLNRKKDFIRSIFAFHIFVWDIAKRYNINLIGKVILEFIISIIAFPYCVSVFSIYLILLLVKFVAKLFILIFRQKSK